MSDRNKKILNHMILFLVIIAILMSYSYLTREKPSDATSGGTWIVRVPNSGIITDSYHNQTGFFYEIDNTTWVEVEMWHSALWKEGDLYRFYNDEIVVEPVVV